MMYEAASSGKVDLLTPWWWQSGDVTTTLYTSKYSQVLLTRMKPVSTSRTKLLKNVFAMAVTERHNEVVCLNEKHHRLCWFITGVCSGYWQISYKRKEIVMTTDNRILAKISFISVTDNPAKETREAYDRIGSSSNHCDNTSPWWNVLLQHTILEFCFSLEARFDSQGQCKGSRSEFWLESW